MFDHWSINVSVYSKLFEFRKKLRILEQPFYDMVSLSQETPRVLTSYSIPEIKQSIVSRQAYIDCASYSPSLRWGYQFRALARCNQWGTGSGMKIAVLDSGVEGTHPDLNRPTLRMDFSNSNLEDSIGMGTFGAGIIAANGKDHGFLGLAPDATLISGKLYDKLAEKISVTQIEDALKWAARTEAQVIVLPITISERLLDVVVESLPDLVEQGSILITGPADPSKAWKRIPKNWIRVDDLRGEVGDTSPNRLKPMVVDYSLPANNIWSIFRYGSYAQVSDRKLSPYIFAGLFACIRSSSSTNEDALDKIDKKLSETSQSSAITRVLGYFYQTINTP